MRIRHPYDFVPLDATKVDKANWNGAPSGHERWHSSRHSGTLVCRLKTETLLCIRKVFEDLKGQNLKPLIPGSSIKGMVRTVAQILGVGCGSRYFLKERGSPGAELDGNLAPCTVERACLVCRVFGYSVDGEDFGWAGQVRFSDAAVATPWNVHLWQAMPKGGGRWPSPKPRTRHRAFYFAGNQPLGWKVYRHAENPRAAVISERATFWTAACVGTGTEFEFQVTYENLTDFELEVLRFALTLQHECPQHTVAETFGGHSLAHKLGYGKPAGLGSCTIRIAEDHPENPRRYFGEQEQAGTAAAAACHLDSIFSARPFRRFLEYLAWDDRPDHLLYPTKDPNQARGAGWFDQNAKATIAGYEATGVSQWQAVRIVRVTGNEVHSEFDYNGTTYCGASSPRFEGLEPGGTCWVWITARNDAAKTYQGITA